MIFVRSSASKGSSLCLENTYLLYEEKWRTVPPTTAKGFLAVLITQIDRIYRTRNAPIAFHFNKEQSGHQLVLLIPRVLLQQHRFSLHHHNRHLHFWTLKHKCIVQMTAERVNKPTKPRKRRRNKEGGERRKESKLLPCPPKRRDHMQCNHERNTH